LSRGNIRLILFPQKEKMEWGNEGGGRGEGGGGGCKETIDGKSKSFAKISKTALCYNYNPFTFLSLAEKRIFSKRYLADSKF
jgi:hypothetical protein